MSGSKILPILMKISEKNYGEENDKGCFLDVDVQYLEKLQEFYNDLPFLPERTKIGKVEKILLNCMIKLNMLYT